MKTHALFPLMVASDQLNLPDEKRKQMCSWIQQMAEEDHNASTSSAWTGDVNGHEFLLKDPRFSILKDLIVKRLYLYLDALAINTDKVDLYIQRSWATYTTQSQNISSHTHAQSHLTFAYYLYKPENSGDTAFIAKEQQNEIASGIFNSDKYNLSLIEQPNMYNGKKIVLQGTQDEILVFPSKQPHITTPNQSGKPRISIAGDVVIMLKESDGFEHLMPSFEHWQKV